MVPRRPRRTRLFQERRQNVFASEGPMCRPTISRLPSVLTATAMMAATLVMCPPSRCLRQGRPATGRASPRPAGELGRRRRAVDVLAQLAHRALADARQAHDPPGGGSSVPWHGPGQQAREAPAPAHRHAWSRRRRSSLPAMASWPSSFQEWIDRSCDRWITATSAFSGVRRGSRNGGK